MNKCWFWLILTIITANCTVGTPLESFIPERVVCPENPPMVVLDAGWQFAIDADDEGLEAGWYLPDHETEGWQTLRAGRAWEQQDIVYDGVAWYRRVLDPVPWEQVFLFVADIDDSGTIWLDGEEVGVLDAKPRFDVLELPPIDSPKTLVIRVEDDGGYGGLKSALRLAPTVAQALDDAYYGRYWAQRLPEWAMPAWTRDDAMAWTMTGGLDHANETLVSRHGAVAPYAKSGTVQTWLVNTVTGKTYTPNTEAVTFSLIGGVPIPQWEWNIDGMSVRSVVFYDADTNAVRWRIWATATLENWQLRLMVGQMGVNGALYPIDQINVRGGRVWLNTEPFLIVSQTPQVQAVGDWQSLVNNDALNAQDLACDYKGVPLFGNGSAMLGYNLSMSETVLDVAMPYEKGDAFPRLDVDAGIALENAINGFLTALNKTVLYVPDSRLESATLASMGYLLVANDRDGAHPGPLAHDAVWTRDMAYIGLALLKGGQTELVKHYVDVVFEGQDEDGRVLPIQGDNVPWDNNEWDAQGQAMFLAVQYYLFTRDLEALRAWYPKIVKAGEYIGVLRAQTAGAEDVRVRGILPISLSAEDLGDGEQHYYWDNFWAVTGLRQASLGAQALGLTEDAARWQNEADDLLETTLNSVLLTMGAESLDVLPYVPASVETVDNSGMGRGSVPLLYPLRLVDNEEWLQRAFETYHQRWIAPSDGGYVHREGQYWTYAGIEMAHAYQRLGRGDVLHQILGWTLAHETLPNTYAWAEQVSPNHFGFTGGDMPHAWMSASFYNLIRNMLVMEDGDALVLFEGASAWWFEGERKVGVERAPTHFGTLTMGVESTLITVDGVWKGEITLSLAGATPKMGYRWRLPFAPTSIDVSDGKAEYTDGFLTFSPETTQVVLKFD